jgi:hypothetical protein
MRLAVKYFALLGVLAVLVVAGTASARPGSANDGALSVKNSDGRIVIVASKGVVIGRFDKGQLTIKDPTPNDGPGAIVTGADSTAEVGENVTRYSGRNIRFRMIGGPFSLTVFGTDIDLSAVGRGMVTLDGTLSVKSNADTDGDTYAFNGDSAQPFPTFKFTRPLSPSPTPPGG